MAFQGFGGFQPFDIMKLRQQAVMDNYGGADDGGMDYGDEPSYGTLPFRQIYGSAPLPPTPTSALGTPPSRMGVPTYGETVRQDVGTVDRTADLPPGLDFGVRDDVNRIDRQVSKPMSSSSGYDDDIDKMLSRFTPDVYARDRFNQFIDKFPERGSPGINRGIAGILMGIGSKDPAEGLKVMDAHMYAPYYRDLAAWKEQGDPYYKAAQLENTANTNERNLLKDVYTTKYQTDRYVAANERAMEKNATAQQRADDQREIGLIRANADRVRAMNGSVEIDDNTGHAYGKVDGKYVDLGKLPDSISAAERENIRGGYRVKAAEASGAAAMERAKVIVGGQANVAAIRGTELYEDDKGNKFYFDPGAKEKGYQPAPGTKAPYPIGNVHKVGTEQQNTPGAGAKPETKAQSDQELQKRFEEAYKNEGNRKWINYDPNKNIYSMKPEPKPSSIYASRKEDIAHWNRVNQLIHPGYQPSSGDSGEMVKVRTPNGNIVMVPRSKVAEATSPQRGGKVVP